MTPDELDREVLRIELGAERLVRALRAGEFLSPFRGRGIEFADARLYEPGDDVRTIDWRVTARAGTVHVRRQVEERELTLMLAVDTSASGDVGSRHRLRRELAAHVAAALALATARAHGRVGLLCFGAGTERLLPPGRGRRHALRLVRDLLAHETGARGTDLAAALETLDHALPTRTVVAVCSDWIADGWELPLGRLASRHDVLAFQLIDGVEQALPDVGLVRLTDPERGTTLVVDSSDPRVRASLAEQRTAHDAHVTRTLMAAGAVPLVLDAGEPFADKLLAFLRRRSPAR